MNEFQASRIAIFTHDAYGLGHVRRCLRIIDAIARRAPDAAVLLITGSPSVELFSCLPPNADYIKIPTLVSSGAKNARPPLLPIGLANISFLRRQMIRETLITFAPDVFLVDNFPLGAKLELLPAVAELKKSGTRLVLGLRDIADPPPKIRMDWGRDGLYEILEHYYDSIVVYGSPEILDIEEAYALTPSIAGKVKYAGYVTAETLSLRSAVEVRSELAVDGPLLLATVGGGGDGFPLIEAVLQSLALTPSVSALIVTGAFMSGEERMRLEALASVRSGIMLTGFTRDLPSYMAAADIVVSMGGYNTIAEILSVGCRSIVIPRYWRSGEHSNRIKSGGGDMEQLVRAETLSQLGYIEMIPPGQLNPASLAEKIISVLNSAKQTPDKPINLNGAQFMAEHLLHLARSRESTKNVL